MGLLDLFKKRRDPDEERLMHEINKAREQLARAYAAQPHVDELKEKIDYEVRRNRLGERLFLEMARTRRRPT